MIYVLYWSICWLLNLALMARALGELTISDILLAAVFSPAALVACVVQWVPHIREIDADTVIWRKK